MWCHAIEDQNLIVMLWWQWQTPEDAYLKRHVKKPAHLALPSHDLLGYKFHGNIKVTSKDKKKILTHQLKINYVGSNAVVISLFMLQNG
jgi:hypothetical protein